MLIVIQQSLWKFWWRECLQRSASTLLSVRPFGVIDVISSVTYVMGKRL